MKTSNNSGRFKKNDDSSKGKLLSEIESISKALYIDRNLSKTSSTTSLPRSVDKSDALVSNPMSKHGGYGQPTKDKKSFWSWKSLKALSHVRNRRFNCCFSLDVHTIEGLPSKFNGISICVHWKRRDGEVVTSPIKVIKGVAEFNEKLTHTCSVYGSRSGPHHSAKYEAKHFLLYAGVQGNPNLDLGKHRVDLTRLLPLTLEELEDEKNSGTWTTSFKLSGEAKGAIMNVSFGYLVLGDGTASIAPNNKKVLQLLDSKASARSYSKSNTGNGKGLIQRAGSLPSNLKSSNSSRSVDSVLHEVNPVRMSELSSSINTLYQKLDQGNLDSLVEDKCEIEVVGSYDKPLRSFLSYLSDPLEDNMTNDENSEFSFVEKEVESSEKSTVGEDGVKVADYQDVTNSDLPVVSSEAEVSCQDEAEVSCQEEADFKTNEVVIHDCNFEVSTHDGKHEESSHYSLSDAVQENVVNDEKSERSCIENGVESLEEKLTLIEDGTQIADEQDIISSDLPLVSSSDGGVSCLEEAELKREEIVVHECNSSEKTISRESLLEDLESVLSKVAELQKGIDSPEASSELGDLETINEDKSNVMIPSDGLDDLTDTVADEFLNMLEIEDSPAALFSEAEPESPRERLLREFELEAEASGCSLFGFGIDEENVADYEYKHDYDYGDDDDNDDDVPTIFGWGDHSDDSGFLATGYSDYPKIRAQVVEDMETQALMQEWGLDENAFQSSPPNSRSAFGSPIDLPSNQPQKLPPLGEGLGPFIQTKTGGFLRSMNPNLFTEAKTGGSLIMQVSSPVVVPAELGSAVMDVLQHLASMGLEKLSGQANRLMPLEDITGRTMQQIAWEASESQNKLQDEPEGYRTVSARKKQVKEASSSRISKKMSSSLTSDEVDSEFVSLEDLAPLAIDKIEALSIEGLRIQSGMSDEEAPSNINAQCIGGFSALEGRRMGATGLMGLEGAAGLKLLALEDSRFDGDDGLMGLSLTLDEWMKLDSGEVDEDERLSARTSKLLAAHHAKSTDLNFLRKKGDKKPGKGSGRKGGLLGNNFTVALMVQLRDPLRNYEPVGTPMLALIQVERVFVPPKPKLYYTVGEARDNNSDRDDDDTVAKEEKIEPKEEKPKEQDLIPQYKISEVHVTGFKNEPGKKKVWGNAAQQQSGSRWLLANGMGKGNKGPFIKPKVATKSSLPATITSQPGDTLWSISARFHGSGKKWKELSALNPHIRNPNVIISNNEIIKLR